MYPPYTLHPTPYTLITVLVQDIGETGLLEKLHRFCPPDIIGDDAAVLEIACEKDCEKSLVITTDMLLDGVHFSPQTTSAEDAGWRAAAANLSDLAAMGATPLGITVGLGLAGNVEVNWVERLYQGMTACLQQYDTPILGGDIVRSPITTIAITALGKVDSDLIIRRSGAQVGDAIVVTGYHGASRAGLELLLHPEAGACLSSADKQALIKAHQRPRPRLDVLPILKEIFTPHRNNISHNISHPVHIAGMDSSDGLADAVLQICHASNVGAVLDYDQIPVPPGFGYWLTEEKSLEYMLYGGEDFELVLCLPFTLACTLVEQLQPLGEGIAIIGKVQKDTRVILQDKNHLFPEQVLKSDRGFQHFSPISND